MLGYEDIGSGRFYHGDCFGAMREIPDGVIDMVLCDLPYGTTQNKWDSVLPLNELWKEYWRLDRGNAAVVLTAAQPFTTSLIQSRIDYFKYNLVWDKVGTVGFQLSKKQPLRRHEDICIFYRAQPSYNPIMRIEGAPRKKGGSKVDNGCYGDLRSTESFNNEYYPTSILSVSNAVKIGKIHPTQKPVALFEYLIKTYTNEGDLVLDNCAGSGTTAIACENTGRRWVCIEKDDEYYAKAVERVRAHVEAKGLPA